MSRLVPNTAAWSEYRYIWTTPVGEGVESRVIGPYVVMREDSRLYQGGGVETVKALNYIVIR